MSDELLYFDHAATTPMREEVREAMLPYLTGEFGNPSSPHAVGQQARRALLRARRAIANWFAADRGLQDCSDESGNPGARWHLSSVPRHDKKRLGPDISCKPA